MNKFLEKNFAKQTIFLLLLIVFLYVLLVGLKGIDFGRHWDESKVIKSVEISVVSGLFLPQHYKYPSVSYYIALLGITPEAFSYIIKTDSIEEVQKNFQTKLKNIINQNDFKIRIRSIFLFLTLISYFWVFFLILIWRNNIVEAFLGAALLISSWELHYHARWIAPDGLMMSFGILSMLLMFLAIKVEKYSFFVLKISTIVVGIACGSKYPGGIFLLPLIYTVYLVNSKTQLKHFKIYEYLIIILIFMVTFIASTPGAIIEPINFIKDVIYEINHYKSGHGGYTVDSMTHHSRLMLNYFAFAAFSKYGLLAFVLFLFVCFGIYDLILNEKRNIAIWFLMVPVVYLLYFANQKVMIVRNLLVLLPFVAILASRGIYCVIQLILSKIVRVVLSIGICAIILVNLAWLYEAAESISYRTVINHRANIISYLEYHSNYKFFVSDVINEMVKGQINVTDIVEEADYIIFSSDEIKDRTKWIVNQYGAYKVVSGIYAHNENYYSTWSGDMRILAVNKDIAQNMGLID